MADEIGGQDDILRLLGGMITVVTSPSMWARICLIFFVVWFSFNFFMLGIKPPTQPQKIFTHYLEVRCYDDQAFHPKKLETLEPFERYCSKDEYDQWVAKKIPVTIDDEKPSRMIRSPDLFSLSWGLSGLFFVIYLIFVFAVAWNELPTRARQSSSSDSTDIGEIEEENG